MKQNSKKIIAIVLIVAIILGGIVVVSTLGFNKELRYGQSQSIDIYVEKEIDKNKIKNIANEVLGTENLVQTIEIYQDMVTIRAKSISEEQKNNIVNKVKENYEFEQTAEKTTIDTVSATRIRDMYKQYIVPFVISGVLVVVYISIRYYKKGILKVFTNAVAVPVIAELLLLSLIAIARIPVGRFVPVLVILMYIASILYVVKKVEE